MIDQNNVPTNDATPMASPLRKYAKQEIGIRIMSVASIIFVTGRFCLTVQTTLS